MESEEVLGRTRRGRKIAARADRGVGPYRGTPPVVHGCVVGADDSVRPGVFSFFSYFLCAKKVCKDAFKGKGISISPFP